MSRANLPKIDVAARVAWPLEAFHVLGLFVILLLSSSFILSSSYSSHPWGFLLAELVLGFVAIHAVLIFHDCMHGSVLENSKLRVFLARVIGAYYLFPFHFLKQSHLAHHKNAGLIEGDTEVLHYSASIVKDNLVLKVLSYLARSPLAGSLFAPVLQAYHLVNSVLTQKLDTKTIGDVFFMVLLWSPLGYFLWHQDIFVHFFLYVWLVPYFIGLNFMYLATYPLHTNVAGFAVPGLAVPERQFFVARTIVSNRFFQFLFCNLNFHLEHHLYPNMNRWNLRGVALNYRKELLDFAIARGLPYMVHPSYLGWHLDFLKVRKVHNPNTDIEELKKWNSGFRTLPTIKGT